MQNDRVAVRDYLSKEKWQFGVVDKRMGNLHYDVKLDDGRQWKRHVDQMRKVGENIQSEQQSQHHSNASDQNINSNNSSIQIQSTVQQSNSNLNTAENQRVGEGIVTTSNSTLPNPSLPSADLGVPIVEQSLRRSSRISKPPNRLQYTK